MGIDYKNIQLIAVDVMCNIAIYPDYITRYSKYYCATNLRQQLELASELESHLWDAEDRGRMWRADFDAGKAQLFSSDRSNNSSELDWSPHIGCCS